MIKLEGYMKIELYKQLKQFILIKATEENKWVTKIKNEMMCLCRNSRNDIKRKSVSKQTINQWLTGKTKPSKENLKILAKYFGFKNLGESEVNENENKKN